MPFPSSSPLIISQSASPPSSFEDDDEDIEVLPTPFEVPLSARQPAPFTECSGTSNVGAQKTRRWHAMRAGALAGGFAVMFEKQSVGFC
jgi:hypothetical protein